MEDSSTFTFAPLTRDKGKIKKKFRRAEVFYGSNFQIWKRRVVNEIKVKFKGEFSAMKFLKFVLIERIITKFLLFLFFSNDYMIMQNACYTFVTKNQIIVPNCCFGIKKHVWFLKKKKKFRTKFPLKKTYLIVWGTGTCLKEKYIQKMKLLRER